ncbi:GlsB/YeaQ/YmgE family stress response membrane protein [Brochothrix campestris]|uniref:GlsB/YeaQ/YmgE family stress response membrane protein n=1 Tax=Brochothrix campestris FSL F6-1037 TaxID=1265861 RepID=W7CEI9_9LIST|nr:GlsB/YeaQ/YmgE family stress response membrane protein [Brochothrix campestris]EUJ37734.1 hypothetical protein BCAMP_09505 [Brochothrix campestris FSL F6-1037]
MIEMTLLIGAIIGLVAGAVMYHKIPASWLTNVVAGLTGAFVGEGLFGYWGPIIGQTMVVPTIIGALFFVVLLSFLLTMTSRRNYI